MTKDDFIAKINKTYKSELIADDVNKSLKLKRFSSGIIGLDKVLGGGWPFGRISLIVGNQSTGKTLLTSKAAASVVKYCRCQMPLSKCTCGKKTPCNVLFVDAEGSYDIDWGVQLGVKTPHFTHCRIEYGEQAVDVIDVAIRENVFDLIVLDSIAAVVPSKEIEKSAEDALIGDQARLMNKAFRKWVASFASSYAAGHNAPALLCINQVREKAGFVLGDPTTYPGGKGQLFAASVIVRTSSAKYEDDPNSAQTATGVFGGSINKNKTFPPKGEFAYEIGLRDTDNLKKGEANNIDNLYSLGLKLGLIAKDKTSVTFGTATNKISGADEDIFKASLRASPEMTNLLWRSIIHKECGPAGVCT